MLQLYPSGTFLTFAVGVGAAERIEMGMVAKRFQRHLIVVLVVGMGVDHLQPMYAIQPDKLIVIPERVGVYDQQLLLKTAEKLYQRVNQDLIRIKKGLSFLSGILNIWDLKRMYRLISKHWMR